MSRAYCMGAVVPVTSKRVFISSTSIDLPEHRQKVIDACNQLHLIPDGMKHWPAADSEALKFCLDKVNQADVFVGIYAHRYGWIPPGESKSITELEFRWATHHWRACHTPPLFLFIPRTGSEAESDRGGVASAAGFSRRRRQDGNGGNCRKSNCNLFHDLNPCLTTPTTGGGGKGSRACPGGA